MSDETSWSVKNENKRIEDNVCGRNVKQPKKNSEVKWRRRKQNQQEPTTLNLEHV